MMNLADLVDRSKQGLVRKQELEEVAEALSSLPEGSEDGYSLLYVLGRSEAFQYEKLIAGFLRSGDTNLARLALQILCTFWDTAESYADEMRAFLDGVEWDDGWVQQAAVSAAGEYLRTHTDTGMLARLLEFAEPDNDWLDRRVALEALAVALRDPVAETLTAGGDDRAGWTARVLSRAEDRLAAE